MSNIKNLFATPRKAVLSSLCILVILAGIGVGTVFGVQVMPEGYLPMDILVKPAGGFIVLGLTLALMNKLLPKKA